MRDAPQLPFALGAENRMGIAKIAWAFGKKRYLLNLGKSDLWVSLKHSLKDFLCPYRPLRLPQLQLL